MNDIRDAFEAAILDLTRMEETVIRAIASGKGRWVHKDRIINIAYGDCHDGGPEYAVKVVEVMVHRVRRKIAWSRFAILTSYGRGYRLVDSERAKHGYES